MTQHISVSPYISTVAVPEPISLQSVPSDDVLRFEQAMSNSQMADTGSQTPTMPTGLIKDAISALEKREAKSNAAISRLLGSGPEMTTSKALEFSVVLHNRSLGVRVVGKVIDGASRAIEKLTSVQ